MIFGFRYQAGMLAFLMDKAGEGGGGAGGGAGDGKGAAGDGKGDGKGSGAGAGDDVAALRAQNKALEERLAKLETAGKGKGEDDPDLADKAKKDREAKEKAEAATKDIETALKFSLGARDWLKTNASILPKDIVGIFDAADKENYATAIEKNAAIKSSVVQEFFKLQANLDLLTPSQKSALEDFLKLTKTGKQEKAQLIYDQVFEPTFEMLKRIKKAEQLGQAGHASPTEVENAYRDRMMKMSKKHYNVGDKADA
jgi:hypothetical protein